MSKTNETAVRILIDEKLWRAFKKKYPHQASKIFEMVIKEAMNDDKDYIILKKLGNF